MLKEKKIVSQQFASVRFGGDVQAPVSSEFANNPFCVLYLPPENIYLFTE